MRLPSFAHERQLLAAGHRLIAGVDEVGCGAWAGSVYTAAVVLAPGKPLAGVNDSKKLSARKRLDLAEIIKRKSLAWSVGVATVEEISLLNVRQASMLATQRAIQGLSVVPDWILSDAFPVSGLIPCTAIIHGDAISKSIAAASILAKVARDAYMSELDTLFPGYHFAIHKGYGTKKHQQALLHLGPSPIHRETYEPIKTLLARSGVKR